MYFYNADDTIVMAETPEQLQNACYSYPLIYGVNRLTILCYLSYYMVVKYGGMKICCKLRYFTGNFSD